MKTIVICSGGLDSVTLAHKTALEHSLMALVSFDYGQRHRRELDFARSCAARLNVRFLSIDISAFGKLLSGSALTGNVGVPDGHYAEESMKITVVPNRNAIMLAMAYGIAASIRADAVGAAFHGGDHFIYPDCRPPFAEAFAVMQNHALEGLASTRLHTAFIHMTKAQIVAEGARIGVPFALTWSCYKGKKRHCGRCGTCVERREAFALAQIKDPTDYEDPHFWEQAVRDHKIGRVA